MKSLRCATYSDGLHLIDIEATFTRGLPAVSIVGLADKSIKESSDRVKSALLSIGYSFPAQRITINLSPSDLPKTGGHFDLAIALLIAMQKQTSIPDIFVFGELGLGGEIKSTANLFSILLFLSTKVTSATVLVPKSIASKACMIPNLKVYAVSTLQEAILLFNDWKNADSHLVLSTHELFKNAINIDGENYVPNDNFELDFIDVLGQERAKRACLISATGMHNIMLEGSPGCGKSMCMKRLVYILPPQSQKEILQAAAYRSLNMQDSDFSTIRAFRNPHHTSTKSSIFGGGSNVAKIGEVALANGGVLFFDEFPHFNRQIIESLREPLEDFKIHISRVNSKVTYETKFLFAAALNPCPCGKLFSKKLTCTCSDNEIAKYKNKISEPILDRIDLHVQIDEIDHSDKPSLSSKELSELVLKAFIIQKQRGQKDLNGKLSDEEVSKFCILDSQADELLKTAIQRYGLSQRGIKKCLRVGRSIADLDGSNLIKKSHILEALSFRIKGVK